MAKIKPIPLDAYKLPELRERFKEMAEIVRLLVHNDKAMQAKVAKLELEIAALREDAKPRLTLVN